MQPVKPHQMTQRDALAYIIIAGLVSLFVLGCAHYAYTRVIDAAYGLQHDPTMIPPYQHSQAMTDDPLTTIVLHHDP